jgi:hypothetical protein
MVGHRGLLGLSLVGAFLTCALLAQSAFAFEAKNTTAVTCIPVAQGDFFDSHCNEQFDGEEAIEYDHQEILPKGETEIDVTNLKTKNETKESTPLTFTAVVAGIDLHVECTSTSTDTKNFSYIKNIEPEPQIHKVYGAITLILEGCTVKKPANCTVGNITFSSEFTGVEGLGPNKNTMGLEFRPGKAGNFVSFSLEGAACPLKGIVFKVLGSAIGTGLPAPNLEYSGATTRFEPGNEMEELTLGGKPAEFTGVFTIQAITKGKLESPIAFTTPT